MNSLPPIQNRDAAMAFLDAVDPGMRRRGATYHRDGAVRQLSCLKPGLAYHAFVRGTMLYSTTLTNAQGEWLSACTCPVGVDCKHAVATMIALLDRTTAADGLDAVPSPRKTIRAAVAETAGPLVQRLVANLQRPLRKAELDLVHQLSALYRRVRGFRGLTASDLQPLFPNKILIAWEPAEWWPKFPANEVEFAQYVTFGLHERGVKPPEFLLAITDIDQIGRALAEARRKQQVQWWRQQMRSHGHPTVTAHATGAEPLDLRLMLDSERATLQARTAVAAGFVTVKPARFRQLAEAHEAGRLDLVPEAFPLWLSVFQQWSRVRYANFLLNDPTVPRMLRSLLQMPNLRERIVNSEGVPFARPAEPLRWELEPAATEADDYRLRLVSAAGTPPPPIRTVLTGRPTWYVTDDVIYSGPPPLQTQTAPPHATVIPAPALESRDGAMFLAALGVALPPRLQSRVRVATMQLKISGTLEPLFPGSESEALFLAVTAASDLGARNEIFTGAGWQRQQPDPGTTRAKDDDAIVIDDAAPLAAVPALLEPLGLQWDNYEKLWRTRLTKTFPEKFAAWLAALPKSIELQLDSELATLAQAPVAATVKLESRPAGVDWFDLHVVLDVADTKLTQAELKALLAARGRFVRLGDKGWRRLQFNLTEQDDEQLARLGLSPHEFSAEPQRLHALQLADAAAVKLLPEEQVTEIRRRVSEITTSVTPPLPEAVRAELRPYQVEGFHFLAFLSVNHFGGILADDMGLGKTLQTLTWLAWLRSQERGRNRPALVVCPKSVMDNWHSEAERFVPGLRVCLWRGADPAALSAALAETDLLVINYAQLRSLATVVKGVTWLAAILDEGQFIKNPDSQTAKVARTLQADHRLVLTGTPIENRMLDLWSLMQFAMPGLLGNRTQFAARFDRADDPLGRRRLAARVRPFLLRRTKAQVAKELPDRVEEDLFCEMEGAQATLYRAALKQAQQMLLTIQTSQDFDRERFHFLTALLRLRQICCHPALVKAAKSSAPSAKVDALFELLEPLMAEGHKVLVFSQFVSMLDILRPLIDAQGWRQFVLTGETENRGALVAEFQQTPGAAVFLISLKAGGFGLNLTAASYVVLFDSWWNPAVETQAIDRTHRIGQTRKVMAYRLLIKDSIEEKIRALQHTKRALAEDILGEENFAKTLSLDDLRFIFADNAA